MNNKNLNSKFESQALKQAISQAVKGATYQLKGSSSTGHSSSTANISKRVIALKK